MKHNIYANICVVALVFPVRGYFLVAESKPKRMPFKNTNWDGIADYCECPLMEWVGKAVLTHFWTKPTICIWTFFEREFRRVTKNIFFFVFRAGFILVNGRVWTFSAISGVPIRGYKKARVWKNKTGKAHFRQIRGYEKNEGILTVRAADHANQPTVWHSINLAK